MKIVLVGPGALGSLLAARLTFSLVGNGDMRAKASSTTIWILDYNRQRANQLNSQGLLLEERGNRKTCSIPVAHDPAIIDSCDIVVLCVKSHSVASALTHAAPLLCRSTLLIGMQNGISHLGPLMDTPALPVAGITSEGATLKETGHVIHGGAGITRLGFLRQDNQPAAENKLRRFASLLLKAGLQTEVTPSPLQYIWAKLFTNVAINALTALHDKPNGWLLESKSCRTTMAKAIHEAEKIAYALKIPVIEDPVAAAFQVCGSTSSNISSMLQDVRKKRITEIDAINGAIVTAGKKFSIPTPVNAELVTKIKELEKTYYAESATMVS